MAGRQTVQRREEGIRSRGQTVAWLEVTTTPQRGMKLVKTDGDRGKEDGGRGNQGADVLHLLGEVGYKVIGIEMVVKKDS